MWFLEQLTAARVQHAIDKGLMPTEVQQGDFAAARAQVSTDRVLSIGGGVATIEVSGILTQKPDIFAWLFGGGNTTYAEIRAAIAAAETDARVKSVDFLIGSPGGSIAGLFDTLDAMRAMEKPTRAVVSDLAASAAYALASQAGRIVATNRVAQFGSVGIVTAYYVDQAEVVITSTDAPDKAPDVSTEEGRAVVRRRLDAVHAEFARAIAEGRGVDIQTVNEKFGRGAVLLADDALQVGMIDAVESATVAGGPGDRRERRAQNGGGAMDLAQLKAEHPDVYAAAVAVGVTEERDRVGAHLIAGEASGDMATAVGAIKAGDGMTATLQAKYMAAGMARRDQGNRAADEAAASAAADSAATAGSDDQDPVEAMAEQVTALLAQKRGEPVAAK